MPSTSSLSPYRAYPALRPGDPVAVVAPASPFDRASFEAGLEVISSRYRVHYDPGLLARHRYLAGSDERRLAELASALTSTSARAIFCARGGYGLMRLLPKLEGIAPTAKPVIGFSDITALHQMLQRQRLVSVHGPVLTQLPKLGAQTHARLFEVLESDAPAADLTGLETYFDGTAEGPLIGGNLAVLTRLLGTPFLAPLEGAILLLEDVGERPYRLDRMWTHLALAGVFRQIRGIVLGAFTGCEEKDADYSSADVLRELAVATGLPCAAGFPIGHGAQNQPVPLGVRVRLEAGSRRLTFLESAARR
ncbi:MAG TPA: LD-carboxypeptidase [Steroidobacteraceae bacterium]|jgi:muramoyltetrapeptide carboxypeptidase|nr:LD-carboxypeptidase [Steroidobacteraceae bacterium]